MESVWKPFVKSSEDDWTKTLDPVERRRIQNRLSQRAKSMDLPNSGFQQMLTSHLTGMKKGQARIKHASVLSTQPNSTSNENDTQNGSVISTDMAPTNPMNSGSLVDLLLGNSPSSSNSTEFVFGDGFSLDTALPAADSHFLILQPLRACDAFARIIIVLNLQCTHTKDVCNPMALDIPASLIPTREQRTIPHLMYVDILPWPSLRKNLLTRLPTLNELEFTNDMQSDHLKVWGTTPWDPMGCKFRRNPYSTFPFVRLVSHFKCTQRQAHSQDFKIEVSKIIILIAWSTRGS